MKISRFASGNLNRHHRSDRKKYDWNKVIENPATRQQYQLELKNRFDTLPEVKDPETMHKNIVEIVGETAQKVIGNPPKRGPKKWVSDATLTLVTNRDIAKKRYQQRKTAATKERWKNIAKQVQFCPTLRMSNALWKGK